MTSNLNQVLRQLPRSPGITATAAPSRLEKRSPLSKIFAKANIVVDVSRTTQTPILKAWDDRFIY